MKDTMERIELSATAISLSLKPREVVPNYDLSYGWGELIALGGIEDPVTLTVFPQSHALKLRTMTDYVHFAQVDQTELEDGLVRFHGDINGITRTLLVTEEGTYMMMREAQGSKYTIGGKRESRAANAQALKLIDGDPNYRERYGVITGIEQCLDRNERPFWKVTVDNKQSFRVFDPKTIAGIALTDMIHYIEKRSKKGYWNLSQLDKVI